MLYSGLLDISPSSSIEYAKHPQNYLILQDLSISSIGPVRSVCLFSRAPIEDLDHAGIGLTTESETSVCLLKIILGRFFDHRNSFHAVRGAGLNTLEKYPAVLLIGDSALKAGLHHPSDVFVYDLGELWYRNTGLPFVFALWIVREDALARNTAGVKSLWEELREAKLNSSKLFDREAQRQEKEWISPSQLVDYWKTISYDLTSRHIEGLKEFFRLTAELGLIEAEPEIRLFPFSPKSEERRGFRQ